MPPVGNSDGSESRLGIDLTLTRHFLADSYSILLDESRLGLDRARLFKTRTRLFPTRPITRRQTVAVNFPARVPIGALVYFV